MMDTKRIIQRGLITASALSLLLATACMPEERPETETVCEIAGGCEDMTSPQCRNGRQDEGEEGIDCGGACDTACVARCEDEEETRCGESCVDLDTSAAHCGACDVPCEGECIEGACQPRCENGVQDGDEEGVDCGGSCERQCVLVCEPPNLVCDGECIDPDYDEAHCGGCDSPCEGACDGGVCLTGIREISVGSTHACMLMQRGEVYCWGDLVVVKPGEVLTSAAVPRPTRVEGLPAIRQIAAGWYYSCALSWDGEVHCWGDNSSGQLGTGDGQHHDEPTKITSLSKIVTLSVNAQHACAIDSEGATYCWGAGYEGAVGNGSLENRLTPAKLQNLPPMEQISAGYAHTCALSRNDELYCWGQNTYGQLGTGNTTTQTRPIKVNTPLPFTSISAGTGHTCALSAYRDVYCWGYNGDYQLGQGDTTTRLVPTQIRQLTKTSQIRAGRTSTCALEGAQIQCWGRPDWGTLGSGAFRVQRDPVPIDSTEQFSALSTQFEHTCALTKDRTGVRCWGFGEMGHLGNGDPHYQTAPQRIRQINAVRHVSAGYEHTCATTIYGRGWCWGRDLSRLGVGQYVSHSATPVKVYDLPDVTSIAAGGFFTCASSLSGGIYCWGGEPGGQVRTSPAYVGSVADASKVVMGLEYHGCALTLRGEVYCWGNNGYGQLGQGDYAGRNAPTRLSSLTGIAQLTAGAYHFCALDGAGVAYCWGRIEGSTTRNSPRPTPVMAPLTFQAISGGWEHTCAVTGAGEVYCWGSGAAGQLGHGTTQSSTTAVRVEGVSDAVQVGVSGVTSCALTRAGEVYCWGNNRSGLIGEVTEQSTKLMAVKLEGVPSGVSALSVGTAHACVTTSSGELWCWGQESYGRLGNGRDAMALSPVEVLLPEP